MRSTASRVSKIGEYGYEPAGNQTGIVTPTFKSWLSKKLASKFSYNPAKAKQILTKAGYKFSGGVFHTKSGKPLSFTMINIGGYSDWVASAQIVSSNLKAIGIKVTASNLSSTTYNNDNYNGSSSSRTTATRPAGPRRTTSSGRSSTPRTQRRSASSHRRTGSATTTRRSTA